MGGELGKAERRRDPQGRLAKDSLLSLFCALLLAWPCPRELAIQSGGVAGTYGRVGVRRDGFPEEVRLKLDGICQIRPGGRPKCAGGQGRSQAGGKNRVCVGGVEPAGAPT